MFLSVLRIKIKIFLITIQYFAYSGLDPDPVYFVYFVVFLVTLKTKVNLQWILNIKEFKEKIPNAYEFL